MIVQWMQALQGCLREANKGHRLVGFTATVHIDRTLKMFYINNNITQVLENFWMSHLLILLTCNNIVRLVQT